MTSLLISWWLPPIAGTSTSCSVIAKKCLKMPEILTRNWQQRHMRKCRLCDYTFPDPLPHLYPSWKKIQRICFLSICFSSTTINMKYLVQMKFSILLGKIVLLCLGWAPESSKMHFSPLSGGPAITYVRGERGEARSASQCEENKKNFSYKILSRV